MDLTDTEYLINFVTPCHDAYESLMHPFFICLKVLATELMNYNDVPQSLQEVTDIYVYLRYGKIVPALGATAHFCFLA